MCTSSLTCIGAAAFDVRAQLGRNWGAIGGCRQITFFEIHFFMSQLCGAFQRFSMRYNDEDVSLVEPMKERANPRSVYFGE